MEELEIYVHTAHQHGPQLISVDADMTVEALLEKVAPHDHAELVLIIEDEDEPCQRHHRLRECHIHRRHHVHAHHCRQADVRVTYNGVTHERKFAPAKTVEKALQWAIDAFTLKGQDAINKVLRLAHGNSDPLPSEAHIGSFVRAENHCALQLNLTDRRNVNG